MNFVNGEWAIVNEFALIVHSQFTIDNSRTQFPKCRPDMFNHIGC